MNDLVLVDRRLLTVAFFMLQCCVRLSVCLLFVHRTVLWINGASASVAPVCRPTLPPRHHYCRPAISIGRLQNIAISTIRVSSTFLPRHRRRRFGIPRRQMANIADSSISVPTDSSAAKPQLPSWHAAPTDSKHHHQHHQRVD